MNNSERPDYSALVKLAQTVGDRLVESGLTFAAAESCTGGLVGHVVTEIAGCSRYFMGASC